MSRWLELYCTSPSGKTLFVCRCCGRVSPLPDKECSQPPAVVSWKAAISCILFEEIEAALIDVGEKKLQPNTVLQISVDEQPNILAGGTGGPIAVQFSTDGAQYQSVKVDIRRKVDEE